VSFGVREVTAEAIRHKSETNKTPAQQRGIRGAHGNVMKVSDLLVACLEQEGVRYVFGIPGEEIEDLLFSLEQSLVRFVPTRHEQGAAFMANVWGRLTGKAGVCLATLGPGATNLITGIADAYLDNAPLELEPHRPETDHPYRFFSRRGLCALYTASRNGWRYLWGAVGTESETGGGTFRV
jgi:hypothetical protein